MNDDVLEALDAISKLLRTFFTDVRRDYSFTPDTNNQIDRCLWRLRDSIDAIRARAKE